MARAPDERIEKSHDLYKAGVKLVDIARELDLPPGTVRRWKSTHNWDNERSEKKSERSERKRGGQPGNKNATGPPKNKHAEKHGFFSKYLPEETFSIIQEMPEDPLDILWDQIQIQYAAIIRAQQIMYVRDRDDMSTTQIQHKTGDSVKEERWEVQQAWDKQGNFLQAQSRAMKTLESLIRQYDELLHKDWDMASEEQRRRIETMKAQANKINRESGKDDEDEGVEIINDAPKEAGTNI